MNRWRRTRRESAIASRSTKAGDFTAAISRSRFPHSGDETYQYAKGGATAGASGINYDDRGWRALDLPHDFVDPLESAVSAFRISAADPRLLVTPTGLGHLLVSN